MYMKIKLLSLNQGSNPGLAAVNLGSVQPGNRKNGRPLESFIQQSSRFFPSRKPRGSTRCKCLSDDDPLLMVRDLVCSKARVVRLIFHNTARKANLR